MSACVCSWQELIKLKRKEVELHQITAQAQGIQTRLKYSNSELESIRKKSIPASQAVSRPFVSLTPFYTFFSHCLPLFTLQCCTNTRWCLRVLQEISRLESELWNLKSQIEMQISNVRVKDSEVTALQDEVNHVSHAKRICCYLSLLTNSYAQPSDSSLWVELCFSAVGGGHSLLRLLCWDRSSQHSRIRAGLCETARRNRE